MAPPLSATVHRDLDELSRAGLGFDDFAVETAAVLRRAVPFDGICIGTTDPSTNLLTRSMKVDLGDVQDGNFLHWEYAEDDVAHFRELAARTVGVSVLAHETDGDPSRSGRFREVVSTEIGAEHELRGVARAGGLLWGTYAIYRAPRAPAFNAAEADYLHRMEGSIAMGIRASTIVAVAAEAVRAAGGPAVLVFDGRGELLSATPAAQERLDDLGGGLDAALPVPVKSLVSSIRGEQAGRGPVAAAHIRARGRSGSWYSINAAPFAVHAADHPQIAVTVEHATPPQILPLLIAAYGLTEREASIVQAMLRGESTHDIAQSLFLSPYTVQDHFKSIFEKIGVSSRREVATRVFYGHYLTAALPA